MLGLSFEAVVYTEPLPLTAKHHDGFAMYRSHVSEYNIVDWTPFQRDPLKELSDACRQAGIRFCVYYSHRGDWDHPDAYGNNWDYDRSGKNFDRYLVGNYGQELMGDYQDMNDNEMPTEGLQEYGETPQTLNTTWGYSKFDQQWKTAGGVIQRLVEIVSKGGNYLLNIGPMADGAIPPPSVATLREAGAWMRKNGAAIYGTAACPLAEFPWGRCSAKGRNLYLHVFSRPADGVLRFSGLHNQVTAAYLLADPSEKLKIGRDRGAISVTLPAKGRDEIDTVVVLGLSGQPEADPPVVTQDSDDPFKRFSRDGKFHIANWTGPNDSITWHLLVSQTGNYRVRIRCAARTERARGSYVVAVGPEFLTGVVEPTGDWYQYRTFDLGTLKIPKAGECTVTIRPAADSGHNLMYFQSLQLDPVPSRKGGAYPSLRQSLADRPLRVLSSPPARTGKRMPAVVD